jgi:hypothetical protein
MKGIGYSPGPKKIIKDWLFIYSSFCLELKGAKVCCLKGLRVMNRRGGSSAACSFAFLAAHTTGFPN